MVVDICRKCGGCWFDAGEMKEYIEFLLADRDDIPTAPIELDKEIPPVDFSRPSRACPRCSHSMKEFNYAYDSNIMLDKCPGCEGIWADRGEIVKLAVHTKGNPKLEALGKSVAEEKKKAQALNDFVYASRSFAQGGGIIWLFIPKVILPLQDDNETSTFPGATLSIIAINFVVFLFQVLYVRDTSLFFREYGLVPTVLFSGGGYMSVITSCFLHGSWLHLLGNMFFFWIFGDNVEDALGHIRFLGFYLLLGICSGLFQALLLFRVEFPAIGASGAISGIMGAYFVLYPQARIRTWFLYRIFDVPASVFLGMWILLQILFLSLHVSLRIPTSVGWLAHIGGFLCGMLFIWLPRNFRIK